MDRTSEEVTFTLQSMPGGGVANCSRQRKPKMQLPWIKPESSQGQATSMGKIASTTN